MEVVVASSFERFEELFASLINYLEQMAKADGTSDLPDEKLRPLVGASERLLKAKPWEYAADNPPFGLASRQPGARPMYAAILGAEREVLGVALYTSLEDYENTRETGEALLTAPEFLDDAVEVLQAIRQRTFLVAFEPRDKLKPAYREQLARCGWPRRRKLVPTFGSLGGEQEPGDLSAEEAADVALAVDALVEICRRHRQQIAAEEFPIRDRVEIQFGSRTVTVDVSAPPDEEPGATPAIVYRFKVSLQGYKDVWRRIDVRGNQTLTDLHDAIQEAFGLSQDDLRTLARNSLQAAFLPDSRRGDILRELDAID